MNTLKTTFENEDHEAKFWIDPVNGSFCIEHKQELIEIPNNLANELLGEMRAKLNDFESRGKTWGWL